MSLTSGLTDSESRLRTVLESIQEGVATFDGDGRVVEFNPAALALHGYSSIEEAHRRLAEFPETFELLTLDRKVVPVDQWPAARVLRGETFSALDLRVRRKDNGAEKVFSYTGTPVFQDGRVALAVVTLQDVTERVLAEEALRKSESQLRDFVENATVGLHWVGPDGTILWANDTELQMLGYTREEYIGRSIAEFHADPPVIDEILGTLTQGGSLHNREARLRCKDGSVRHVLISSNVFFEGEEFVHTRCFTRDISERKQAEEALHEMAERLSALADNIDQLAWMADAEGYIYWYNRRWHEYTGKTPEEMEGWGWQSVHDPEVLPMVLSKWKQSLETGETFSMEFPLLGADGVFRTFLTRVHPVRDESGSIKSWFGTNTDVSEMRDTQKRLQELTENLEHLVQERTDELLNTNEQLQGFTYSVAHDFRQLIRSVGMNAALVKEDVETMLDPEGLENLSRLMAAAKEMSTLTDQLLEYARLGQAYVRAEPVDLSALAEQAARNLRHKPYCNLATEFRIDSELTAHADAGLMRLVLENLLDNACKYSHRAEVPVVEVGKTGDAFFVRDNGVGFESSYAEKLFQPFERLHAAEGYPGTGIGLANVKRIIERHGGRVWAESSGQGATFYFTLGS